MAEFLLIAMLITLLGALLSGYPVAFVLPGVALLFALFGHVAGVFDLSFIAAFPDRIYGIMMNPLLLAVPLFIFMGVTLQRSGLAERLLTVMSELLHRLPAGLAISVVIVGVLLGASTGIVGATVVTMGLISLPCMMKANYPATTSTGVICASGTLGQLIPPSIVLILLADQISNAYQSAQMQIGNLAVQPVSVADIFVGALVPGLVLVALYILWLLVSHTTSTASKQIVTGTRPATSDVLGVLLPPLLLILLVLGSILAGLVTATESAAIGALGALILSLCHRQIDRQRLHEICMETAQTTSMIFAILIGATLFTLVFRGLGGDEMVHQTLSDLPGGLLTSMLVVMFAMFLLGFFLDFIEIIFVVVPIVAPVLLLMGADPIWLAVMIAINLQTSFLTPPFGFALFYLRGVAERTIPTTAIYRGVLPFVAIQLAMLVVLFAWPRLATWLPEQLYGTVLTSDIVPLELIPDDPIDF